MGRRVLVVLVVIATAIAAGWVAWRWQVQTVDVVIVNESGADAELSWRTWPFGEPAVVTVGPCESRTLRLHAGETWRFQADGVDVGTAAFEIPLGAVATALEVWLEPDGSSRLVLPYPVTGPVSAPVPSGCAVASSSR